MYGVRMDTLDRFTPNAAGLLDSARRVRILDDGIRVAREELDELAGMVATLPSTARVPEEISIALRELVARMDRYELERDEILDTLEDCPRPGIV